MPDMSAIGDKEPQSTKEICIIVNFVIQSSSCFLFSVIFTRGEKK